MGSNKPGLFGRLKRAISGSLNDAVESLSDPGQEIALMLDNLADQIKKADSDLRDATVSRKMAERKTEELRSEEQSWQERAQRALQMEDESLARAALEKKTALARERRDAEASLAEQSNVVADMKASIESSRQKLKSLNLRRGTLMAQARSAKAGDTGGSSFATGAEARIDEIEHKITQIEVHNEIVAEEGESLAEAAAIDRKLNALNNASELDDELEALKAKLRGQNALSDGKS
ncbi:MAG: PspA/IM30 family protein [Nannocystaceae bacterium]